MVLRILSRIFNAISYRIRIFVGYTHKVIDFAYLRYHGVETKFGYVKLLGFPYIHRVPDSKIIIGRGVTLVSDLKHNIAGINHAVILATLNAGAVISIDEGSGASGAVICAVNKISIGKHVGIGANSKIYDSDFHPVQPGKRMRQQSILDAKNSAVIISDHSWIGEGALVLKGAYVGVATVLSARSVLSSKTNNFSIYAGNPAVFIKEIVNDLVVDENDLSNTH